MKIKKVNIKNYRLLKDFELELEDNLSLIIGKNNTGKTSILTLLDKFLNKSDKKSFAIEDFNLDFRKELNKLITQQEPNNLEKKKIGIQLRLEIEYTEADDLSNINRLMMDLSPDNNRIILGFDYVIGNDELNKMAETYLEFQENEKQKKVVKPSYEEKTSDDFLKDYQADFFNFSKKSIQYDTETDAINEENYIDLEKEKISLRNIIEFTLKTPFFNIGMKIRNKI